ncbi:response regulator [Sphingobium sufflavum]|uniref:response regulator n=1 Tax=Sphingobium sufflavum TaxID=1129547 RepID=UPI001F16B9F4|nr:response regulator [Sphingobium sufflavum]MCE7797035.1 response regulator [Sphingobium sufflavum]
MGLFSHLARPSRTRSTRAPTRTVLIVEDEPLMAFDNEYALAQAGYRVAGTVDRYDHAVAAMADRGIDLVIADIRLPGDHDGIDVARYAVEREVAVLFSTAACPLRAGQWAVGWLAKPYAPRDLVRAIRVVDTVLAGKAPRHVPDAMTLFPARSDP